MHRRSRRYCQSPWTHRSVPATSPGWTRRFRFPSCNRSAMQLVEKMCVNPAKLYHFDKGYLTEGGDADIVIFNENEEWTVTDDEIASKSHNTPFIGTKLFGRVKYTICGGKIVYKD